MSETTETPPEWIPVVRLLRPQGRRGELLADPLTDLHDLFEPGREFVLADEKNAETPDPQRQPVALESRFFPTGRNAGRIVVKLSGTESISDAEALAGRTLLVRSSELPALEAGTYFVRDLLGCTLFDAGRAVGPVTDVEFAMSPDGRTRLEDTAPLLVVEPAGQPEAIMVPFIAAWIDRVDLDARELHMNLPAGLLGELGEDS